MSYLQNVKAIEDIVKVFYEMIRGNLGISGGVKCIVNGYQGTEVCVKDTVDILQCLDIQHPVGVYIVKMCQGHKDVHGCGVKSVLFLTGQLCKSVRDLVEQGVPLHCTEELLYEAIEDCVDNLHFVTFPVMHSSQQHSARNAAASERHLENSSEAIEKLKFGLSNGKIACDVQIPGEQREILVEKENRNSYQGKSKFQASHQSFQASLSNLIFPLSLPTNSMQNLKKSCKFLTDYSSDFPFQLRKSVASCSSHRKILQSSRHLKHCVDGIKSMDSSLTEVCQLSEVSLQDNCHPVLSGEHQGSTCKLQYSDLNCGSGITLKSISLPTDAHVLSHGCSEMMSLAREAMSKQLLNSKLFKLDLNLIHTVRISGFHGHHHLLQGLIVQADRYIMELVSSMKTSVSVLLVNGDVTAKFKHRGYRATMHVTKIITSQEFMHHSQHDWHKKVLELLMKLEVTAVLVRGMADLDLKHQSLAAGIAVIDCIPYRALHALQVAYQVDPVTYVLEAHQGNICRGVHLRPLLEVWGDSLPLDQNYLLISAPAVIQTLVIREPSAAVGQIMEEEFWHCAARLDQAVEDAQVLPGGGATEQWCAHHLLHCPKGRTGVNLKWAREMDLYRPVVRAALADAFLAFSAAVTQNRQHAGHQAISEPTSIVSDNTSRWPTDNSGLTHPGNVAFIPDTKLSKHNLEEGMRAELKSSLGDYKQHLPESGDVHCVHSDSSIALQDPESCLAVCDNYSSKVSGWRSAISCVCTVMKMDMMVTTGVNQSAIHHVL